jgi:hypothetical protein
MYRDNRTHLKCLHDMEVRHIDFGVLGEMGILHSHKNSLLEEVFIDESAVPFWHQHSVINEKTKN